MPEEDFVAGVDPRLKLWLRMRQEARAAQLRAGSTACVTSDIQYKLHRYWTGQLLEGAASKGGVYSEYHKAGDHSWEDALEVFSIETFQAMIAAIPIVPLEEIASRVIKKRNLEYLKIYCDHMLNINVHISSLSNRTMLHIACWEGELNKVIFLLDHGAHVDAVDATGATPLHLAIQTPSPFHSIAIIKQLLLSKRGCKVNARNSIGQSPLHLACIIKSAEIIDLLLRNSSNPYALDSKHSLPIDHTKHLRREFCVLAHRYSSRQNTNRMWARVAARDFVASLFKLLTPNCDICKRSQPACGLLKKTNYRYWLLAHKRLRNEKYDPMIPAAPL